MKFKKKSLLMALVAILVIAGSFWISGKDAQAASYLAGGYCGLKGDNIEWYLSEDGVLTFEGTGDMANWDYGSRAPWYPYMNDVKQIVVKKGITSTGSWAFAAQYPNLKKITFPKTLTTVGYASFYGCEALETIILPEGVTWIKDFAFSNCVSLDNVTFPASLKKIGKCSFSNTGLTTLTVPSTVTSTDKSFQECQKLVSAKFCAGSISDWEFYNCDSLKTVTMTSNVTSVGFQAFSSCASLKNVTIGSNVTYIEARAFEYCTSLEEIVIPDSVSNIGDTYWSDGTFAGCTSLKKVTLGTGIKFLGANTFAKCGNITEIYFCGDAPTFTGTENFAGSTATAYYPKDNSTWRPTTMTNHGGKLDWVEWEVPVSHYRPSITSVTNKSNGIEVKWSKVKYADGYYVYRKAGTATKWTLVATTKSTSRTYLDKKATYNGRKYQYKIVAFDNANVSKNSSSKTKYYVKCTTPSSLSNLSGKKMKVKWSKNSAASGYQIRYSKKSSFSTYSTKTVGKVTNTTISKLTKGSTYYVKMRAYKTVNGTKYYSDWSTVKKVKITK